MSARCRRAVDGNQGGSGDIRDRHYRLSADCGGRLPHEMKLAATGLAKAKGVRSQESEAAGKALLAGGIREVPVYNIQQIFVKSKRFFGHFRWDGDPPPAPLIKRSLKYSL